MACNCGGKSSNKHDLVIERGATFTEVFAWRDKLGFPIDLTGYTAAMQIRRAADWSLVMDVGAIPGAVVIEPVAGTVTLTIPDENTASLPYGEALVWDIKLTSSTSEATRLLKGSVLVDREVTE